MEELENSYLRVWVDKSIKLLYSEWLRPVSSKEYREGSELLLSLLKKYKLLNWISDSANLGDITAEDEQWGLSYIFPAIARTSLLKVARISNHETASTAKLKALVNRAEEAYIGPVVVRDFDNFKEAADWVGDISA